MPEPAHDPAEANPERCAVAELEHHTHKGHHWQWARLDPARPSQEPAPPGGAGTRWCDGQAGGR